MGVRLIVKAPSGDPLGAAEFRQPPCQGDRVHMHVDGELTELHVVGVVWLGLGPGGEFTPEHLIVQRVAKREGG